MICLNELKQGYVNLKNRYLFLFVGIFFACGRTFALPQDWPCDEFDLNIVDKGQEWGHVFRGNNGSYEITIHNFDENHPYVYSCGNSGCQGTIRDIKTDESENMRFDCLFNSQTKSLRCYRIDGGEYLLTKDTEDKYKVKLCGNYYKYLNISQCLGCKCILHDSRGEKVASDIKMNCIRESDDKLRCFSYDAYERWRNFENKDDDFENCIGLNI